MGNVSTNVHCSVLVSSIVAVEKQNVLRILSVTLHEDLKIPYVREVIFKKYAKHHRKLETHPNPLLHPLLDIGQLR